MFLANTEDGSKRGPLEGQRQLSRGGRIKGRFSPSGKSGLWFQPENKEPF